MAGENLWEDFVERDESEDLPSIYYEIVPAANGRVCDLRLSGLHTTYEGATIVNRTIHTLPPMHRFVVLKFTENDL